MEHTRFCRVIVSFNSHQHPLVCVWIAKLVAAMWINAATFSGWLTAKRLGLDSFRSQGESLHLLIGAAACFANMIGFIWFPFDLRALPGFAVVSRGFVKISGGSSDPSPRKLVK